MSLERGEPYAGRWRPLLQRAFRVLDKWQEDVLFINAADPLALEFAQFGEGSWIKWPWVFLGNPTTVAIGKNVEVHTHVNMETLAPRGSVVLRIGDLVRIGHYVRFVAVNGIEIGKDCGIGHGVTIADSVHDWQSADEGESPGRTPLVVGQPLRIEDGAWIGNGSTVIGGVTIGERAIIGPHSVVTRDVPPETMVSGIPARRVPYPRSTPEG